MSLEFIRSRMAIGGPATAVFLASALSVLAQERPNRLMPFLCRDAVVRESVERVALAGQGVQPMPIYLLSADGLASSEIVAAARDVTTYIEKITGVKADVKTGVVITDKPLLEVYPEMAKADGHGFLLATRPGPAGPCLCILGASRPGTVFGAWFFIHNYLDVRLVLPGEIGRVYPKRDRVEIPKDLYLLNPAPDYLLRIWSGPGGMRSDAWLADTGGTQRFEYHHNLYRIYDPARFGATHREYYPVVEGKPKVPDPKANGAWQPTFSQPSVAQRAIEYADELFTKQPWMKSVSLSVNDGLGYSETDMRKGRLLPDGQVSLSNIYCSYVNAVAKAVKQKWPDKYVAFFPYNFVRFAPDFPLEDNVMVFLVNEPKVTWREWEGRMKAIGIYQWLYGCDYLLPNHWPHAMQDYLKWAQAHGGRAFKGECYAAWANDGPKMWVLANLLWNTDLDVDALLTDYYEHAYGKDAAPAIARYFAQCEKAYERRRTAEQYNLATWKPGERQFEKVTAEDLDAMSAALAEAARLTKGEAEQKRIDYVTRCFRWGEFYGRQCDCLRQLQRDKIASDAEAGAMLDAAARFYSLNAPRDQYFKENVLPLPQICIYSNSPEKPDAAQTDPDVRWRQLDDAMDQGFNAISAFKKQSTPAAQVAAFWAGVSQKTPALKPFCDTQRLQLLCPGKPLKNFLTNPGFEEPPVDPKKEAAKDWNIYQNRMVNATCFRDTTVKRSGQASLSAKGITDCTGAIRLVTVPNNTRYRVSFWYKTGPETRHGEITIMRIPPIQNEYFPPAADWTRYEKVFTVTNPGGPQARFYLILELRHGGTENSQIWFDDVALEMLAPEGVESP